MTNRIVMASRRFPKDYSEFVKKYSNLEENLREFLAFRQTHLPNESFGAKDSRMTSPAASVTKLRRYHLIHGRAILIYQLYGSEIRLIALQEHDNFDSASNSIIKYHRSLQPDDYYACNLDELSSVKPAANDSIPIPTPPPLPIAEEVEALAPEPEPEPEPVESATNGTNGTHSNGINPLWNDKVVDYLEDRQMLYVPRPARPVVAFILDREVIAPRGDVLLFDPTVSKVHHLSRAEFEAGFLPHSRHTTDLGEAFAIAMQPIAPQPKTKTKTRTETVSAEPEPVVETVPPVAQAQAIRRPKRKNNVGSQIGRLMAVMAHVQRATQSNKVDSVTMREYLQERDVNGLSTTLFNAQEQGLVKKVGPRPGSARAFYYCLTPTGEKKVKLLGDWPFTAVGQKVPFHSQQRVAA